MLEGHIQESVFTGDNNHHSGPPSVSLHSDHVMPESGLFQPQAQSGPPSVDPNSEMFKSQMHSGPPSVDNPRVVPQMIDSDLYQHSGPPSVDPGSARTVAQVIEAEIYHHSGPPSIQSGPDLHVHYSGPPSVDRRSHISNPPSVDPYQGCHISGPPSVDQHHLQHFSNPPSVSTSGSHHNIRSSLDDHVSIIESNLNLVSSTPSSSCGQITSVVNSESGYNLDSAADSVHSNPASIDHRHQSFPNSPANIKTDEILSSVANPVVSIMDNNLNSNLTPVVSIMETNLNPTTSNCDQVSIMDSNLNQTPTNLPQITPEVSIMESTLNSVSSNCVQMTPVVSIMESNLNSVPSNYNPISSNNTSMKPPEDILSSAPNPTVTTSTVAVTVNSDSNSNLFSDLDSVLNEHSDFQFTSALDIKTPEKLKSDDSNKEKESVEKVKSRTNFLGALAEARGEQPKNNKSEITIESPLPNINLSEDKDDQKSVDEVNKSESENKDTLKDSKPESTGLTENPTGSDALESLFEEIESDSKLES